MTDPAKDPHTLGEACMVVRPDQTLQPAAILQTRYKRNLGKVEHYVHYTGANRRLDEWVPRERIEKVFGPSQAVKELPTDGDERKLTRNQRRGDDLLEDSGDEEEAAAQVKLIKCIEFGEYEVDTWYYSPYPEIPNEIREDKLYVCEFCFKYTAVEGTFRIHQRQCQVRQPPGREIYRKGNLSMYEVDGKDRKLYCQCLCLLAKLFLDHKTLYFSVEAFRFYILCEVDRNGAHFVGYFSKEKRSPDNYNVACIMTLPPWQRKGYGKFLIQFSYELSKIEGVTGTPERPLSDLGKLSYKSYWTWVLLNILKTEERLTVKDLSWRTAINEADIITTLTELKMVRYWNRNYVICVSPKAVTEYLAKSNIPTPKVIVDMHAIKWSPEKRQKGSKKHG